MRHRDDKDSPVRQGVDAGGCVGNAIGHAPFVAQAAPVPGEKESPALGVFDGAGREQRLAIGGPRDSRQVRPAPASHQSGFARLRG